MPSLKYIVRVVTGMRWSRLTKILDEVKEKSGHSRFHTLADMAWCAVRYGAGYHDYIMFGFYDMNGKQRDTYLTRVRNKRVQDLMNPPEGAEEFNDKLLFNRLFAPYLNRKTLDGTACTLEEFTAFLEGQEAIFAKINRGDSGRGVEKLWVKDFPSAQAMLDYTRAHEQVVLEHVLPQHPDMSRLHPHSVNCLRILTDRVGDNITIAYITAKIGAGGGYCDNAGRGGVLCRVDIETGKIISPAQDDYFKVYETHPDTGIRFQGYQLPMVQEAVALAKEASKIIPGVNHIGWDIAIAPDGPAIIEGNDFPGTDLCQLAVFCPEKEGLWPYYKRILNIK